MFDKDITLINKVIVNKNITYKVSHLKGFWSSSEAISINGVDLVGSKRTIVRILYNEPGYVEPKSFNGTGWTLRNDDYIVKGGLDISSVSSITSILDNYECLKITDVAVKDYGSSDMWHFEISGE